MNPLVAPMPTIGQSIVGQDAPIGNGVAASVRLAPIDNRQEYVTAGRFSTEVSKNTLEILTQERDELQRFMGPRVYDAMDLDAEVNKCLTVLKTYTLSDGPMISPAVAEQDEKNFDNAKWLSDFVTRACNNIENSSVRDVLEQMMDCMKYGHKVAEKTYDFKDTGPDAGLYLLKYLKVKKQKSIAFAVDRFKNVIGFKVRGVENTPTGKQRIIPRDKFFVITFRGKDADPRGTSILRAAYHAWHLKMMMWPEYVTWLKMCAVPGLIGITSKDNDEKNYLRNADGSPVRDAEGSLVTIPATSQLADALASLRNASAIAIPAGSEIETVNQQVSSEPFKTSRDVLNEEIEMCLLLQTLATSDSRHNTRAASQTAMTVLDILVFDLKQIVADAFRRDVVKHLIKINLTKLTEILGISEDDVLALIPKVTLGDTERRSWAVEGVAATTMYTGQMLKESQLPGVWRQLGIDPPAEGDTGPNQSMIVKQPAAATGDVKATTGPPTGGTNA
jgi:hypothetical protein